MRNCYPLDYVWQNDEIRTALIYEIALDTAILRFAASSTDIIFNGYRYRAWEIDCGSLEQKIGTHIERIKLKFDNTNRAMYAFVSAEDFTGKTLCIKRIARDSSHDGMYDEVFYGRIETPRLNGQWVEISATQGAAKYVQGSTRLYSEACQRRFGDEQCNYNGLAELGEAGTPVNASGTADSGTTTTLVDDALTQEGADYWAGASLTLSFPERVDPAREAAVFQRGVAHFNAATHELSWTSALPYDYPVDSTTTYALSMGDALTYSGTADSGSVISLVCSGLGAVDDYWKYGLITLAKSGYPTERRDVTGYDAATNTISWDMPLAWAVDDSTTFDISKGCDKTWDTCCGNCAYGPSGDNRLNYGGFLHINKPLIGDI